MAEVLDIQVFIDLSDWPKAPPVKSVRLQQPKKWTQLTEKDLEQIISK